ncbi:UDP-GlcNAc:betaGal beta-1,3-N-acetylglucosaminyltransferase 7 isoform X2 [Hydra vulgaris]|uniref:Hexosyltransferase n=1 Tax=Hydra vulgaris TaxID=6087 RepID=A0ABM4BCI9_HYDVU
MLFKSSNKREAKTCTNLFKQSVIRYFVACIIILAVLITVIELIMINLKTKKHSETSVYSIDTNDDLSKKSLSTTYLLKNAEENNNNNYQKRYLSHIVFQSIKKDCNTVYTAVVIISSHASFVDRRNTIRKTWGKSPYWNAKEKYLIIFVVGRTIDSEEVINVAEEGKLWNDIIFVDLFEEISTLTKKMIIGLIWTNYNVKYEFVFKGHDDIYLNINNLLTFVKNNNIENAYFGYKIENADVKKIDQYKMANQNGYYVSYCSGVGYILSKSSIKKMIPLFDLNSIFSFDDEFVGEIAIKIGVIARHAEGFYINNDHCSYSKDIIVSHPIKDINCNIFLLKSFLLDSRNLTSHIEIVTSENTSAYVDEKNSNLSGE